MRTTPVHSRARRCRRAGLVLGAAVFVGGCAIAPVPGGDGYAGPFRLAGSAPEADIAAIAGGAGDLLAAIGIPGAGAVSGIISGVLGWRAASSRTRAIADAEAARARLAGERVGWEDAAAVYGPRPAGPVVAVAASGGSGGGDSPGAPDVGVAHA